MNNKFYVVKVGEKYVKITKGLVLKLTTNIDNASYWTNLDFLKSWKIKFDQKFRKYKFKRVKFIEL